MSCRVLHLFAGAGGTHLTGKLLGWKSAGTVEIDPYCQAVIRHHFPNEVIHGDIKTFIANRYRGEIEGVCGGFPCQDISCAGKGAGIAGERSGLWKHFSRVIGEARPTWAFIENSPLLRSRGLEVVLGDLAALGYDAEWATYRASDVGAPHRRDRIFILAYTTQLFSSSSGNNTESDSERPESKSGNSNWSPSSHNLCERVEGYSSISSTCEVRPWWEGCAETVLQSSPLNEGRGFPQPLLRGVDDGVACRVERIKCVGNGWVPQQAAEAFKQLRSRLTW